MPGRRDRDSGAAMVEFAIVLPVLLLLLLGIIDFGRAFNQQIVLTQAAREGVRELALKRPDAEQRTRAAAFPYNDAGLGVQMTACAGTPATVQVTTTRAFQFTGGVIGLPPMTLTGRGQMRCTD